LLETLAKLGQGDANHAFTLTNIAALIAHHLKGQHIALLWHLDKFHQLDTSIIHDLVAELGILMIEQRTLQPDPAATRGLTSVFGFFL
jgi:hypothetical protein